MHLFTSKIISVFEVNSIFFVICMSHFKFFLNITFSYFWNMLKFFIQYKVYKVWLLVFWNLQFVVKIRCLISFSLKITLKKLYIKKILQKWTTDVFDSTIEFSVNFLQHIYTCTCKWLCYIHVIAENSIELVLAL